MEKRVTIELLVEAEDPDDRVEDDVIAALSECLRHFDIMNYTEESKPAPALRGLGNRPPQALPALAL